MLAEDLEEDKLRFPLGMQPKIDGVRGWYPDNKLLARSNKEFGNRYTQRFFSDPIYRYIDGEFAAERETHPDLCRITSSATRTFDGEPWLMWHAFDYLHPDVVGLEYEQRHALLVKHVDQLWQRGEEHLRVVPMVIVHNLEQYLAQKEIWLKMGYEGVIVRDLKGKYKFGRSTVKQMGLLRGKDFIDFEFVATRITEGRENLNEATINERGRTERSTHQENMVPNGMVGNIIGNVCKDVKDPQTKKVLLTKGQEVTVSPGEMDHDMRRHYFLNQHLIIGQINKAKFFPKGHKDKPRFPIWQSLRSAEDM
jgi:DNA ligase-1